MSTCARCGAANQTTRASCFICYAPLEGPLVSKLEPRSPGTTLAEIAAAMPKRTVKGAAPSGNGARGKGLAEMPQQQKMLLGVLAALLVLAVGVWLLFFRSSGEDTSADTGVTTPMGVPGAPPGMTAPGAPPGFAAPPGYGPAPGGSAGPAAPGTYGPQTPMPGAGPPPSSSPESSLPSTGP